MKKLWLLVFPICLLLSCVACNRAPFGFAISSPSPETAPTIYVEEGANQQFVAPYAFTITWCIGAPGCSQPDPTGPCTEAVQGKAEKDRAGNVRYYVGTCKINRNAETPPKDYFYAFNQKGKASPTRYDHPDNIQPCTPRCSKGLHSQ
jgi:hypothetical protein